MPRRLSVGQELCPSAWAGNSLLPDLGWASRLLEISLAALAVLDLLTRVNFAAALVLGAAQRRGQPRGGGRTTTQMISQYRPCPAQIPARQQGLPLRVVTLRCFFPGELCLQSRLAGRGPTGELAAAAATAANGTGVASPATVNHLGSVHLTSVLCGHWLRTLKDLSLWARFSPKSPPQWPSQEVQIKTLPVVVVVVGRSQLPCPALPCRLD